MLTIEDLEFRSHKAGFQAVAHFENGWGVSILPESNRVSYEVAILRHENGIHSHVSYESGLTDDVFRYLSRDEVYDVVFRARNLPSWQQEKTVQEIELERLYERLDDAVTVKEQQRIATAIHQIELEL